MTTIRLFEQRDLKELERIHARFFSEDFPLEAVFDRPLSLFTILDEEGDIVCVGGLRSIAEAVLITNKEKPIRTRGESFLTILTASRFSAHGLGYSHIHAFINPNEPDNDVWLKHLQKVGFKPSVGKVLVLPV